MPPAATLHYSAERGGLRGDAVLDWQPDREGYALHFKVELPGRPDLDWFSRGSTDGAGLAPLRMVERRRGRDARAVNFQREQGLISFSGPTAAVPLLPGSQDKISWIAQLAGAAQAGARRWTAGAAVSFQVASPRGEFDLWRFECDGRETLDLAGQRLDTVRWVRQPMRPYDARIEVWLASAHHHLPVQIRMTVIPGTEALELQLQGGLPDGPLASVLPETAEPP